MGDRQQVDYFIDFGDETSPKSIRGRAIWHEGRRQRVIVSILLELHLMALTELIPKSCRSFKVEKAAWQDNEGRADDDTQAAHCVPRQLVLNGKHPHEILERYSMDRRDFMQGYFGKTDLLPVNFNKCDSRAERVPLVNIAEGFRKACRAAITSGQIGGQMTQSSVGVEVAAAFSHYTSHARNTYNICILRLKQKLQRPVIKPADKDRWKEQLQITQNYLQEVNNTSAFAENIRLAEVKNLIDLYKTF
ncbi:MAG: hypothetical protein JSS81_10315 [Acidobacteria bacterium]|nr:hypothetical protein [Acidobacteriota bacterium]